MKSQKAKWPVVLTIVAAIAMYLHARPTVPAKPVTLTIDRNTPIEIRLERSLGSKSSRTGEQFSGRLAKAVVLNNQIVVPEGTQFSGRVLEAAPAGRLAGGADLRITLTSFTFENTEYPVETTHIIRVSKGKGKRTAEFAGGAAALGAAIGALAGGGKGALIGAAVGAGAGAVGSAETGNARDIFVPAESLLTFRLIRDIVVSPKPAPQPSQTDLLAMIRNLFSSN